MQIPRWRNVLVIRNSLFSLNSTTTHFALFHSTPTSCAKSKDKGSYDKRPPQEPHKDHVRYVVRQNRAAAKRALKGLVFNTGSSNASFMDVERMYRLNDTKNGHVKRTAYEKSDNTIDPSKPSAHLGKSHKSHKKKIKRNFRRKNFAEDSDDDPEPFFQATLGNRCYTCSFNSWQESPFQNSTSRFEWREYSNWKSSRTKRWESTNETESDDGSCYVGSRSDRIILDLPPTGPLKIEDVKNAFRLSALKWHPDKHQGPSQAMAEEKFKLCSTAYKSLCSALSPHNL